MTKNSYKYSSFYYSNIATNSNSKLSKGEIVRIKKIVEFVGKNKVVLDLGCFNGYIGSLILKHNNIVYGIDASAKAIDIANRAGIIAKIGNLENRIDFKDDSFDVVICAEVIEHILDTDFFLDEIKRVLKNMGYLIISTPNVASIGRRILLFFGKNPFFEASYGFPMYAEAGHIRFFTKGLLFDFLRSKGFEIINFTSNVINFTNSGKISSAILANLFPTLGSTLILKAKNKKRK